MTDMGRTDELDNLVDQLQSRIDEEEAKVFSRKALEEARHPSNMGPMEGPTTTAHRVGTCGDSMEFFVKIEDGMLVEVTFLTDGCGATVACGSMLTKMAKGCTVDEVMSLREADLIESLEGLPEENLHCARLAVGTLQGAVNAVKQER
jgi:nitrogen fixation NifU-like protein